jgi:hypothetical protein
MQIVKLKYHLYKSLFWNFAFAITLFGSLAIFILPERYMFDAQTIVLDLYNESGWIGSYNFTMLFYEITGLNKVPFPIIAFIQIPFVFLLLCLVGIPKIFAQFTMRNAIIWFGLAVFAIYLAFPSKEFITALWLFLIVFVILRPISLEKKIIFSLILFLIFGWFYREYFILVPILALGIYLASRVKIRNKVIFNITIGILIVSFMSLSHGLIKGKFITQSFRNKLNIERIESGDKNAATMIQSPIEPGTFQGEVFGIVYGFLSVNFPLNGLRFLNKPQVLVFVLWQIALFLTLIKFYSNALKNSKIYNHELWVFHLLFAYFIIQGIFEPDLGSAVKHKLGVFPLIWLAFYYDQNLIRRPRFFKKYIFKRV